MEPARSIKFCWLVLNQFIYYAIRTFWSSLAPCFQERQDLCSFDQWSDRWFLWDHHLLSRYVTQSTYIISDFTSYLVCYQNNYITYTFVSTNFLDTNKQLLGVLLLRFLDGVDDNSRSIHSCNNKKKKHAWVEISKQARSVKAIIRNTWTDGICIQFKWFLDMEDNEAIDLVSANQMMVDRPHQGMHALFTLINCHQNLHFLSYLRLHSFHYYIPLSFFTQHI